MGLNQMWSFKKPKINPSQWQHAPWGEQRSKAKRLYKMFIFGGLCGLVFRRALTPTRPTIELETEGRRQEVGCCQPYPCTPQTGACSAFKVGRQLVLFLPPAYPENSHDFCSAPPPPAGSSRPKPRVNTHTHSQSPKSTVDPSCTCQVQKGIFHICSLPVHGIPSSLSHSQYPHPSPALLPSLRQETRGAVGLRSPTNEQEKAPGRHHHQASHPPRAETCLLPTHTHTAKNQTNRAESIKKQLGQQGGRQGGPWWLPAPILASHRAAQPSVARMTAAPKMPTLSPRSFIWFQNSTRRVLCQ